RPITPHTVAPVTPQVTPHTLTPVTPGTFTPIAGGAGAEPEWTIGPITLGGQQSWPVSAHTITGGWSGPVTQLTQQVTPALTPVFGVAAGGGGAAPQWTIPPITLGGQQSWPGPAHTITGGWSGPVTPIASHVTPVLTPIL